MITIRKKRHAAVFVAIITGFAATMATLYDYTMLSGGAFQDGLVWRVLFAMGLALMVAIPVSMMMLKEYRLKTSLEFALTYDALTGTFSRRAIFQRIENRQGRNGILVLADIDHFKSINDRFGHAAGDAVLRHFGSTSRHYLRTTLGDDRAAIGRVGGEEFLIHLDMPELSDLRDWIEGLRMAIRDAPALQGDGPFRLTASYGVTRLDGRGIDEAMLEADTALYAAKEDGRDRCVIHLDGARVGEEPVAPAPAARIA